MIRMTTDHDEIRRWAEARGATPGVLADQPEWQGPGLRLVRPGEGSEDDLQTLAWDEFFRKFDRVEPCAGLRRR